ncbi:MAG: flippase-like domain-containing protein [Rhodospirillaceae bacterium]|nr:flippase-like domain-containing protein [Rhodospirillaceae bacterium]MBT5666194.1 flippase-like domain-containing protein [Rhodospirillaceae bacterium]MBT5809034.1 flippase-like domain-containing protein [Rhodospirillaceae bacterium]
MKQWFILAVKAAFTAGLIWWLLGQVEWDTMVARLRGLDPAFLALAFATVLIAYNLLIVRWWAVNKGISISLPLGRTIRYSWIGAFFNQTLPSTVGGDAVRVWYLYRTGETLVRATSSLLLDRLCGLSGLLLIVLFCQPLIFEFVPSAPTRWGLAALVGAGGAAIIAFVLIGRFRISLLDRWAVTRHLVAIARDANTLIRNPVAGGLALFFSIGLQLLVVVTVWLVGQSMGGVITFAQGLAFVPPVVLAATIPISVAGWGVREGAMVVALGYVGVSATDAVTISVIFGLLMITAGLPGGLVWLLSGRGEIAQMKNNKDAA